MRWTSPIASSLTYSLGKSLYVPITARCNTKTLPATRGANLLLPAHLVAALCRVRDVEDGAKKWEPWCRWLDMQESSQKLPEALEMVADLSIDHTTTSEEGDDGRRPSVDRFLREIRHATTDHSNYECIVIAGEGEPTLRFSVLLTLVRKLKETSDVMVRIITNGLVADPEDCATQLRAAGVDAVSVALMTHDPVQYDELMAPVQSFAGVTAHGQVCNFLKHAVAVGLKVECTGADRPEVNKELTTALAKELGVQDPVRWRSYNP
jgi:pyruvate-formate lyase-activating enzyme